MLERRIQAQGGAREEMTAISGEAGRKAASSGRGSGTMTTTAMKQKNAVTSQAVKLPGADGDTEASNTATRQRKTVSLRKENIVGWIDDTPGVLCGRIFSCEAVASPSG